MVEKSTTFRFFAPKARMVFSTIFNDLAGDTKRYIAFSLLARPEGKGGGKQENNLPIVAGRFKVHYIEKGGRL